MIYLMNFNHVWGSLADNWNRGISVEVLSGTAWNRKSCNMAWLFYAFFHLRVMGLPRLLNYNY